VSRSPLLRPNTAYMTLSNLVACGFEPVLIVFEVRQLGLSGLAIGAVAMLGNLGFLAGSLVTRRLGVRIGIGPVICLSSPIGSAGMLVMALAPRAAALPVLVGGQMLFGFGIALFNLQSLSLRQAITPPGLLGRVNAVVRLVGWGTVPVGAALGGWLGGVVGLREVLVGCGVASMLTSAVPLLSQVRRVRQTPETEPAWTLAESPSHP
jgi:MFS family permease